jgi:hypothetical protein
VADEREDKPAADADPEQAKETSQETAVGHSVIEEPAAEPARETAVGHPVVEAEAAEPDTATGAAGTTEVFFTREEPGAADPGAPQPAAAPPTPGSGGTSPAAADRRASEAEDSFSQKPELFVAGAFVAAFVLGKLLKKLTGSDD